MSLVALTLFLAPKPFWVFNPVGCTPAERAMVQSVQGIVNRKGPLVWIKEGEMSIILIGEMQKDGWKMTETQDAWSLVKAFRSDFAGAVRCNVNTESLNRAASLAGQKDLLVVDESLVDKAKSLGFSIQDSLTVPKLRADLAVEQPPSKPGHLRDFSIKHKAEVFWFGEDNKAREAKIRQLDPGAWVLGWGPDEYWWIRAISQVTGSGIGSDWCTNLSAMESLGGKIRPTPKPKPEPPLKKGERAIAFVLTDGDNIQWLTGGMPVSPSYYGNPHRGEFKITWEVSVILAPYAPRVLDFMYQKATPMDGFVAAGAPGYSYAHFAPNPRIYADQTAPLLRQCGLNVVGVINDNEGSMKEVESLLDKPEVAGVLYKDYSPYHGKKGAILWHKGKPCVSYRFLIWDALEGCSPDDVLKQISDMTTDPKNPDSYGLVSLHAWSYGDKGGIINVAADLVKRLPKGTRIVTAPELVSMLAKNCKPSR